MTPKTVSDIMTRRVIVLAEEENLELVEEGMEKFGLRHLPVVDEGKLVGLVSHRDVLRASVSSLEASYKDKDKALKQKTFVSEIMTRDVQTVSPETSVLEAGKAMLQGHYGCLPVVDEKDVLVGIVTEHDFLKLTVGLLDELEE